MVKIAIYIAVKREESLIKANSSGFHMAQNVTLPRNIGLVGWQLLKYSETRSKQTS